MVEFHCQGVRCGCLADGALTGTPQRGVGHTPAVEARHASTPDRRVAGFFAPGLPIPPIPNPQARIPGPIESCIANGRVPAAACPPLPGVAGADKPPLAPNRSLATQGAISPDHLARLRLALVADRHGQGQRPEIA